ncbi:MAG: hypothetical protein L0H74_00695 [Brachybacterium sp.]|nr:hypothetical protein [Brachybacterium sp.]
MVPVLLLSAASCGGDDESSNGDPATSSPSPTPSEPDKPAWEKNYSQKQVDAFDAALARWGSYKERSERIFAAGKSTPEANKVFKEFFPSPVWKTQAMQLEAYDKAGVKIEGLEDVYWSRPKYISKQARSVVIDQCVDYTSASVTQNGKPAVPVKDRQRPSLRTINMEMPKGYDWLIYRITESGEGEARPCKP